MITPEALAHLRTDPVMARILDAIGPITLKPPGDPFHDLLSSVASQQLSTKAAATIFGRFRELCPDREIDARRLLAMDEATLRGVGFSRQKSAYLQAIARFHLDHGIGLEHLAALADEEVIAYLTPIKGVGRWTAEMLLMFSLHRPDVLPVDDLGIQQGMRKAYPLEAEGKAFFEEMRRTAEAWRPYRSVACLYLWRWNSLN